jgi:hypothetical protein
MWRDNNEDCKIIHSSSTAPVLNFTKPGGNMVGITGSLVGRVRDTITDLYGRWCGYTLIGRDNKEIMVLTAYNVSQYKNAKVGEDTLFNQQVAMYKLNTIREPDPKKIFINDLTELVMKARKEDKDIILTGDFNELVGDDTNGMARVLSAGGLTDVHSHQHGVVDTTTYTRGKKRLDYVFVTPRLIDHILRSGYESFHARIASDHRGYFVDFALAGFLDRQLPSIFSASSRAIRGTHPSNITKYVEYLDDYLEERDIYRRVKEQQYWYNKAQLEKLDRIITRGMLEAEDQCRIHHRQPWSKEVNEVMTTANILRINLSSLKNNIDCSIQIAQKQSLLKKEIEVPKELKAATLALSIAQKNCRKLIKEQRTKKTSIDEEQEAAFVAMNPEMDAKRAAQIFKRAEHTRKLACSAMSPKSAWIHYSAVFQSSVGYPLSMCHLSQHQLHDLQKKYVPTLMNKIGLARTHAHVLVFGTRAYGGIGCNDLRIEQGLDAVQNLMRQLRTPGYGKQLATIFLRTYQNASGMSLPLLQYPTIRAPHLEGHYYVHIGRFLAKHSANLEIECIPKATYERQGDEYIMDVV